ncbi:MAG: hypothetical protein JWO13_451 [Acidobacteriales bacterium]|nr:hypothetical protein [Terriglobales bacterium]
METAKLHESTLPDISSHRPNWLLTLGLDTAKIGLMLYVLGLVTSGFYYSRFSILTLDFSKAQSIVLGLYVVCLYLGSPLIILYCVRKAPKILAIMALCGILTVLWLVVGFASGYTGVLLGLISISSSVMQILMFVTTDRDRTLNLTMLPGRLRSGLFLLIFSFHFSQLYFPQIPVYFGGGRPMRVQVFTKSTDLPANRFVISKNQPQINKSLDSFSLQLLYESDHDVYFINDLKSDNVTVGYSVMRIKKDEIIRVDYMTPKWVQWKGEQ